LQTRRGAKRNKRSNRFFAAGEVSLLREGIRFVFTDASRIMKKRIADSVKKKGTRKEVAGGGKAKRNAEGMPLALS